FTRILDLSNLYIVCQNHVTYCIWYINHFTPRDEWQCFDASASLAAARVFGFRNCGTGRRSSGVLEAVISVKIATGSAPKEALRDWQKGQLRRRPSPRSPGKLPVY